MSQRDSPSPAALLRIYIAVATFFGGCSQGAGFPGQATWFETSKKGFVLNIYIDI